MKFHKNKLLTAVAAAALTFGVAACSSNNDADEASLIVNGPDEPEMNGPDEPELSELATAQKGAMDAATAAMTESDNAAAAATAAMAAVANLATMQWRAGSRMKLIPPPARR